MLWSVARGYRMLRGRDGMGGGDPPLLGAIGLWIGPMGATGAVMVQASPGWWRRSS